MSQRFMFQRVLANVLLTLFIFSAAGCNAQSRFSGPTESVTVQLSWIHNAEFVGFYVAEEKGYYAEEGLKVNLLEGSPTVTPTTDVSEGRAQFGVAAGNEILSADQNGKDLMAIATILQNNPLVVITLKDSYIQNPQDLVGKTVGVITPDMSSIWDIQFLAMLKKLNIDPSTMTFVPIEDYHGANELISGKLQAISGFFATNERVQAELDGVSLNTIYYSDYGIVAYADPIFTSKKLIQDRPDLVGKFVRATLRGYQFAIENPDEAAKISQKFDKATDPSLEIASIKAMVPLVDTGQSPIGWMNEEGWKNTQDIMLDFNLISSQIDLTSVYTNQFVEKAK